MRNEPQQKMNMTLLGITLFSPTYINWTVACYAHFVFSINGLVRTAHATLAGVLFPLDDAETRKPTAGIKRSLHEPEASLCCNNKGWLGEFARDPMAAENRGDPRFKRESLRVRFLYVTFFAHTKKVTRRAGAEPRIEIKRRRCPRKQYLN